MATTRSPTTKTVRLSPAPEPRSRSHTAESAAIQSRTRQQHAQERAQDYVEAIAGLISEHREARATDLAKILGVTHVTVIRTVQRLQRDGLVTTQPYRSIFLTDAGRKLAVKTKARHEAVIAFLEALGISAATARADAEGIEHHVSPETLAAFAHFVEKSTVAQSPRKK
jgi:DtxR family manganese transport transcriptional regulator